MPIFLKKKKIIKRRRNRKNESLVSLTHRVIFCVIDISVNFICPFFSMYIYIYDFCCFFFFFSTNLQCSAKLDLNIFRLTVPIICIPLTHSEQRHLSRNTADKRETINPGKITGTESLSCILPEMRQRSYYVHPSGLASESKQYSSVDMVLFKGTLHWTEISAFRQSLLLLRCGSAAAFLKGSSAPQNYFVAQVLHVVDETMHPLPKGCLKSKADSMRLLKNGDSSVARWSYTHFTGFSFMLTPHPDVSCKCQFAFNEPNKDRAFQIQVLQL